MLFRSTTSAEAQWRRHGLAGFVIVLALLKFNIVLQPVPAIVPPVVVPHIARVSGQPAPLPVPAADNLSPADPLATAPAIPDVASAPADLPWPADTEIDFSRPVIVATAPSWEVRPFYANRTLGLQASLHF